MRNRGGRSGRDLRPQPGRAQRAATYTEADKNRDLYYPRRLPAQLGELGRVDPDGYLWITGRAKDLIIPRRVTDIDPAEIEEALAGHPSVAIAGGDRSASGAFAGELPCGLCRAGGGGRETSTEELMGWCKET